MLAAEAAALINGIVSNGTDGYIKSIVEHNNLDRIQYMFMNVVYFDGTWHTTFPAATMGVRIVRMIYFSILLHSKY